MEDKVVVGIITAILIVGGLLCDCVWSMIFYIGLFRFGLFLYSIGNSIRRHFIQKPLNFAERYGKGSWVFITGAANGIGLEYSHQFSKLGFNIIMVDIDEDGLQKGKEQIQQASSSTEVETIVCDLSKLSTVESVSEVINKVSDKDISILINNAGLADLNLFIDESKKKLHDVVQINLVALAMFTTLLFKKLESRKKKSAIINMASAFGYTPTNIARVYSMTKAFVLYFTKSISYESNCKIDILAVCPGFVSTNMTLQKKSFDTITPTACVKGILKDLGQTNETNTHWIHELIFSFVQNTWYINKDLTTIIFNKFIELDKPHLDKMIEKHLKEKID